MKNNLKKTLLDLHQFDIVEAYLGPTRGSEQRGYRPCIILLTNAVSQKGETTILAPLTSSIGKVYPYEILIEPNRANGLQKLSKIKFDQLRVADKSRISRHIGRIDPSDYFLIYEKLSQIFDLRGAYL